MPLMRYYDYDYYDSTNSTAKAISSRSGSSAPLSHLCDVYHSYHPSCDLNRSLYTTPSGCSVSYRMNMTIHDFENCGDSSFYDSSMMQKKKKSRVRLALKELVGRPSRRDSSARLDSSRKDAYRSESPRKRNGFSSTAMTTYSTLTPRNVYRAPSADMVAFSFPWLDSRRERRQGRHHPSNHGSVKVESYAVTEPRAVEFGIANRSKRSKR
ncbi:unnamed protein product [Angiostrongylus costaricensis]|uniref:DUF4005 domain-containing protein n=1 Tax=Angiostrongylus costaricensis TaxID=334426 RepID=A0A0R3PX76_ANGCS|nr:unnamed protein product [Angiostrongylus costaricensis]